MAREGCRRSSKSGSFSGVDRQRRKPYTVRYDGVNAMLLNEFLKEHRKVEEQDRKLEEQGTLIAKQQQQIETLAAGLQK